MSEKIFVNHRFLLNEFLNTKRYWLKIFAKIELSDIKQLCNNGILFRLLSLEQYLKVYRASSNDGYRITVRQKKDHEKIAFIENLLKPQ